MDPITIAVLLLLGGAAVGITLAAVEAWIESNRVPNGAAELVRTRLSNGNYQVVVGIFDYTGKRVNTRTWSARRLDEQLNARFQAEGDVIHVTT